MAIVRVIFKYDILTQVGGYWKYFFSSWLLLVLRRGNIIILTAGDLNILVIDQSFIAP